MLIAHVTPARRCYQWESRIAVFRASIAVPELAAHAAAQPTLGGLVASAVQGTYFLSDIEREFLATVAANGADAAAELWEEGHGSPLCRSPCSPTSAQSARDLLAAEDEARVPVRLDGIEASNLDREIWRAANE